MTEKNIKWITILMAISMVGLVGFQAYWISNVIEVGHERFKQTVHEAINAVAKDLEQKEVLYTAEQKLKFNQDGITVVGHDSIRFISKENDSSKKKVFVTEDMVRKLFMNTDTINLKDPNFALSFDSEGKSLREGQFIDQDVLIEITRSRSQIDTIQEFDVQMQQNIEKVREKTEMVMIVLNELISKERKITNRINTDELTTLLSTNFLSRGIDIDYSYGVYNEDLRALVLTNDSLNAGEILKSDFRTKLFRNDVVDQQNYLYVYFPLESFFIFGKIAASLGASVVLLLVILFCFGYAIYTIRKQKQISEVKNDFINNMTHEFKTPISTISLACEALQDPDIKKNEGFLNRYTNIIKDENRRLGMQVEKVLQMATLDKKEFKLKMEKVDIHEIIDNAIQNINLQVEKRGGAIKKDLKAKKREIVADEVHLTNIIYNLLDNANKYSPEKPEITITTHNVNGGLSVKVEDKGVGMSKDVQSKIFEKFYRVPTGNLHDVKGFGLGLAYVKTMLEAQGGRIGVKSIQNKGSEFEIYLPQNGQ